MATLGTEQAPADPNALPAPGSGDEQKRQQDALYLLQQQNEAAKQAQEIANQNAKDTAAAAALTPAQQLKNSQQAAGIRSAAALKATQAGNVNYGVPDTNLYQRDTQPQQHIYDSNARSAYGDQYGGPANYWEQSQFQNQQANQLNMGNASIGNGAEFRGDQNANIAYLQRMQAGLTPSVAELQLRQGGQQALAAQSALAASARGSNLAGAQYGAAQNSAGIMGNLNQQQAVLRAQEQQAATGMLTDASGAARLQDLQTGQAYAQIGQQYGQAATDAQQRAQYDEGARRQAQAQRDQTAQNWYNMGNAQRDAQYNAQVQAEQDRYRAALAHEANVLGVPQQPSALATGLTVGGTVAGGLLGFFGGGPPGAAAGASLGGSFGSAAGQYANADATRRNA